jgi:hypothetical protein
MFVFISELLMFITTLWWVWSSFDAAKNLTRIDDVNLWKVITELNWKNYDTLTKNSRVDKKNWVIFKQVILEFKQWDLNPNLCTLLNSKTASN